MQFKTTKIQSTHTVWRDLLVFLAARLAGGLARGEGGYSCRPRTGQAGREGGRGAEVETLGGAGSRGGKITSIMPRDEWQGD